MSIFVQDLFLIKRPNAYFGHINHTTKPTIFAFKRQQQADVVRKDLTYHRFLLEEHNTSSYKLTFVREFSKKKHQHQHRVRPLEIEQIGTMDLSIYVAMNGVQAHIVEDIIEDDEGNMFLVNHSAKLEPIAINTNMLKMHFARL